MGKHLHIDSFAGIAGDMFLGACIDLGAPLLTIDAALRPLPITIPWRIQVAETTRHAIRGIDLKVQYAATPHTHDHSHDHNHDHGHGHSHDHTHDHHAGGSAPGAHAHGPHTGYRDIMSMINLLDAPERAKDRARSIVTRLGEAEAAVHGIPLESVHFHEVGAVDSIIDMLGAAVAVELLDINSVSAAPLPIGHGFVKCDHGNMPLPAPATAQILRGVPHFGVEREGETVTPTGAAIVWALAESYGPMPMMQVDRIGYGAGDRDPVDVPNLLRLFMGRRIEIEKPATPERS